ncbi:hypothetical protein D9M72_466460 [compost metagenome]
MIGARHRRGGRGALERGQRVGVRRGVGLQQRIGQRRQRERIAADAASARRTAEQVVDARGLAVRGRRAQVGKIVERAEPRRRCGRRRGAQQVRERVDLVGLRIARAAGHGVGKEQRLGGRGGGAGRSRRRSGSGRRPQPREQVGERIVAAGGGRGGRRRHHGVGDDRCAGCRRSGHHAHREFEAADDEPRAVGQRRFLARAQRHAIALHRIAAAIDDEVLPVAAQHLRVHARDGAVGVVEHQRVGVGAADGAAAGSEVRGDGRSGRHALPGDDSDMDHESAPDGGCARAISQGVFIPWGRLAISP